MTGHSCARPCAPVVSVPVRAGRPPHVPSNPRPACAVRLLVCMPRCDVEAILDNTVQDFILQSSGVHTAGGWANVTLRVDVPAHLRVTPVAGPRPRPCVHPMSSPHYKRTPSPAVPRGPPLLAGGALGEDVVGLVLHQHLHALHVPAPGLQAVSHPPDLREGQGHMGVRMRWTGPCGQHPGGRGQGRGGRAEEIMWSALTTRTL